MNAEGESEPLESDKSILAKNPYDEPDKPGKPKIKNWDRNYVDLKWDAPATDGGSPITGYIIENKISMEQNGKKQPKFLEMNVKPESMI